MIPALQLLAGLGSQGHTFSQSFMYWGAGIFSAVLDNAPTYVNFFTLTLSMFGLDAHNINDVKVFLESDHVHYLMAVSTGSVFFGAMTYIGNGPNFMVKAIAEQTGVKMPGFFEYIYKYSLPVLLPILTIVWLVFYL
ncbi:MAG: sodium:proton antiporter [Bacteroidota bacterium]